MTSFDTPAKWPRLVAILTAWVFLFAAEGAFAKNNSNSDNHSMKSSDSGHKEKHKDKDKSGDKSTEKDKKHKDKDKEATKDKTPVIVKGGFVRDKLPNGTSYYRRATKGELDMASKGKGGATATTGNSGGTTPGTGGTTSTTGNGGATTAGNTPPPAAPVGDTGPVVRDHRSGGNAAGPAPGTIIRDHRNGADGKPVVVVSSGPTGTVTRPATDADLRKAGLKSKPAAGTVTVPIGGLGGGR